jgi:cytoskeletal protein CcmA (bactofilin family)
VIVFGSVNGNITASDRVDIRDAGAVDGNIVSPRVSIADGAHFRGSVDMQKKSPQLVKPSAHNVTSGDKSVHAAGVAH